MVDDDEPKPGYISREDVHIALQALNETATEITGKPGMKEIIESKQSEEVLRHQVRELEQQAGMQAGLLDSFSQERAVDMLEAITKMHDQLGAGEIDAVMLVSAAWDEGVAVGVLAEKLRREREAFEEEDEREESQDE